MSLTLSHAITSELTLKGTTLIQGMLYLFSYIINIDNISNYYFKTLLIKVNKFSYKVE